MSDRSARSEVGADRAHIASRDATPATLRRQSAALRCVALAPIRVYQRLISPLLPRRCKYEPTCSAYAVQAIEAYGILRGSVLAALRLLRCNPWSHGGYDPVSAQTLFGRATTRPSASDS